MYLSIHCCHIVLLSFGVLAEFNVKVEPDTPRLGENAHMNVTYTLVRSSEVSSVSWFNSDENGERQGNAIVTTSDGNPNPNGRYSINTHGDLKIANVTVNDTGYYQCEVTAKLDGQAKSFNMLTVYYLETPALEPREEPANENETVRFTCSLPKGVPASITIGAWLKNDHILDVSDTEKYQKTDTSLEISRVNGMDEGDYQCRAENAAYSGDEGKLSNKETLSVLIQSSQQPVTHETIVTSMSTGDIIKKDTPSSPVVIIVVVIGLVVLIAVIVGGFSYKNDKLCFIRNATKASGGGSEKMVLSSNFSDVDTNTYAQVQKPKKIKAAESEHSEQAVTETNPPDKPQRAPSRDRDNVEQLTYADLDLVKSEAKVIRTDPETEYSSVRTEKQLTYADLDLTKDVNTGSKDKIIRTQPETEYSSVMITKK